VGAIPAREAMQRTRELAQRAHELDPELPEAHAMLAIVAGHYDYDWVEAERRFREAVRREPLSPHLRQWYGSFWLVSTGRSEEALLHLSRVLDEDPLCQMWHLIGAGALLSLGRIDEAGESLRRALQLDPDFWLGSALLARWCSTRGEHEQARRYAEHAMARAPWSPFSRGVMAGALANAGESDAADALVLALKNDANGGAVGMVFYWLCRGDIEAAVEWAGKAAELRFPVLIPHLRNLEPLLRQSAAWPGVLKRMNLNVAPLPAAAPASISRRY